MVGATLRGCPSYGRPYRAAPTVFYLVRAMRVRKSEKGRENSLAVMETMKNRGAGPCLVIESLSIDFGGLRAVDGVNLTIEPGERRVLMGPNGAGKTTLFNLVSGIYQATSGRILYFERDITGLPTYRRAELGIARTYQITNLFPKLTVAENILMSCQALTRAKFVMFRRLSSYHSLMERCNDLLKEFDLWEKRDALVKNLSHGDQRQIEVAMALAEKPRLLLLDEPAAGLSSAETHSLTLLLKKLDPSITILLIEHDMDVAFEFAEKITVLYQGKFLTEGTKEEIKNNPTVQEIYLGAE
jgi:branched-chain amino acid transport system ATP-binding protein